VGSPGGVLELAVGSPGGVLELAVGGVLEPRSRWSLGGVLRDPESREDNREEVPAGVLELAAAACCSPGAVQNRENEREEENRENEVFCATGDRERATAVYFRGKTVQSVDTLSNNPLNGILSVRPCLRTT
jgi:hypothetical protein